MLARRDDCGVDALACGIGERRAVPIGQDEDDRPAEDAASLGCSQRPEVAPLARDADRDPAAGRLVGQADTSW
jgi:hypothetical protein